MTDDLLKEPLPEPWTFGVTKDGRVFFINDEEKITTWLHPDTGQPAMTGYHRTIDLPSGWERAFTPEGDDYYINHNNGTTSLDHPTTPAETIEEPVDSTVKKKKRRLSFTGTLSKPLFRRTSSKSKTKPEKTKIQRKERRHSSTRKHSVGGSKGIKMTVRRRDPDSPVTRSGWLYKQDNSGVGGVKIWRKRWFVLSDFCLFYYKDTKEDEVLGSIVLPSYDITTVNPDDKINRKYAFKIEHPGMRTYYISAESYNDMAEWVKVLTQLCKFQPNQSKSGSRKSLGSRDANTKPTDEDAEFGFNETRNSTKISDRKSDSSTPISPNQNQRIVANGNNNNAKISTSSSMSTPSAKLPRQQSRNSRQARSSSASSRTYNSTTPSSGTQPRRQNSAPPKRQSHNSHNSAMRYTNHNGDHYSDVSTPENKRLALPNNKVERNNSMLKLGNWVQSQRQKQHSTNTLNSNRRMPNTFDTASEMSSASSPNRRLEYFYKPGNHSAPQRAPSGKRYKPGSYNDYMDPTEVASSIMSVPPMYRNKVMSLPRPRSSQELDDKKTQRRRMANSKSVGYLSPDLEKPPSVKTKSEHNLPQGGTRSSQNHYQQRIPTSAHTPRRNYDDVFSPQSNGYHGNKQFKFDSSSTNRTPSFNSPISPSTPNSNYEVRQMDVKGKKGQLRAFAISVKPPNNNAPPQNRQNLSKDFEKLNMNEDDIEAKLRRLNELDEILQKLSNEMLNLQNDKRRLEMSLQKAKVTFSAGGKSEFELEQKLSKVKSQLAVSAEKLKEMTKENEAFEREIRKMKAKLLEELNKKIESKSNQRQLEWELGRVEFMMEGVNKNKVGLVNKMQSFQDDSQESDLSPPNSGRSSTNKRSSDFIMRSPRDVKRISTERRTSGGNYHSRGPSSSSSTSHDGKYFTLPGHGVSRASSVDSLTAASLARYTRPLSARSTNLHRTKSAAERLLSGSHGNLTSSQDPTEIKRIQREINQSRRRTLTGDFSRRYNTAPRSFVHHDTHMQVGIDVQMAIKHHRMPKVLQRAKRDMQRAESERQPVRHDYEYGFDIDHFEEAASDGYHANGDTGDGAREHGSPLKEEDVEPDEVYVDLNLTHQLIAPDKVDIPDRLLEYEDVELSPEQEKLKRKKIRAIESMLSRSGQTASQPTVHLAAALAAEAGTVARAVAYQAQHNKDIQPSIV